MSQANVAVVLMVERKTTVNGFYAGVDKRGRAKFAWTIAGAKLYLTCNTKEVTRVRALLMGKGYKPVLKVVKLI